jgi:hypothetical protein
MEQKVKRQKTNSRKSDYTHISRIRTLNGKGNRGIHRHEKTRYLGGSGFLSRVKVLETLCAD